MFKVSRVKRGLGSRDSGHSQGGFEIADHKTHQIKGGRSSPFHRATEDKVL